MAKAFLFDVDGVLTDSADISKELVKRYFSKLGKKVVPSFNRVSKGIMNSYLQKSSANRLNNVGASSFNFYKNMNNRGRVYINNSLRMMGIKNPSLYQRNMLARYVYTGKIKYYRKIF